MVWAAEGLTIVVILLLLMFAGQWIAYALGITGVFGLLTMTSFQSLRTLGEIGWNGVNNFDLTAIPLFVFMGEILLGSNVSVIFYRGLGVLLRKLPGGLLHSNVAACALFAAISGSSTATAAAIGTVAIPEVSKYGYNRPMLFGSLAGGGTLGILIPPSIAMIIYASMTGAPVGKLFMAGVIPGIIATVGFMVYIAIRCMLKPSLAPRLDFTGKDSYVIAFLNLVPIFLLILVILGGIYAGIMTATEAASIGVVGSLVMALLFKRLNFRMIVHSLKNSIRTTSALLLIVVGAQVITYFLARTSINLKLTNWVVNLHLAPTAFFVLIVLIYLVLGLLMDSISMILLTLPVLFPIISQLGFDPIVFGVILTILIEVGQITPPVGLNLFVIQGVSGGRPMGEVTKGAIPYALLLLALVFAVWIFPDLSLWLPSKM